MAARGERTSEKWAWKEGPFRNQLTIRDPVEVLNEILVAGGCTQACQKRKEKTKEKTPLEQATREAPVCLRLVSDIALD